MAAADDGIDVRTASTYTLLPKDRLVRVVVDVTARNTSPSTTSGNIITRYFFNEIHLALQPEAVHARATQDGQALATATDAGKGYVQLALTFRAKLYFGQTARVRVTYDLPGGKPRSKSDIRVGAAFATFYAWVNGDRASIRMVLPDTFEPSLTGEALVESHEGSKLVYSADGISDTAHWYAAINADRPTGLRSEALTIPTGEAVTVRAWPEDGEWLDRVEDRLRRGLPELDRLIGLPWPVTGKLVVTEVHTPLLEGYSGIYHPDTEGIEISEDLDDLTIVHEASHAWFNSGLFDGRWINEGLANTYGTKALNGIGIDTPPPFDYPRPDPAAFALNDWPPLGRISDDKTEARENYGYQTSFRVIQAIVTLTGDDGMRKVFAAAAAREIAYVGAPTIEHRPAVADWRALLDYLQERADSSNAETEFRLYVVGPADLPVLDTRATARQAYARLYADGQGWFPPFAVRSPMASWDFATATQPDRHRRVDPRRAGADRPDRGAGRAGPARCPEGRLRGRGHDRSQRRPGRRPGRPRRGRGDRRGRRPGRRPARPADRDGPVRRPSPRRSSMRPSARTGRTGWTRPGPTPARPWPGSTRRPSSGRGRSAGSSGRAGRRRPDRGASWSCAVARAGPTPAPSPAAPPPARCGVPGWPRLLHCPANRPRSSRERTEESSAP